MVCCSGEFVQKQVTTAEKAAPAPADTDNTTQATQEKNQQKTPKTIFVITLR